MNEQAKPLDLEQFEGHTPRLSLRYGPINCILSDSEVGELSRTEAVGKSNVLEAIAARVSAHDLLLAECKRQRKEIATLDRLLRSLRSELTGRPNMALAVRNIDVALARVKP